MHNSRSLALYLLAASAAVSPCRSTAADNASCLMRSSDYDKANRRCLALAGRLAEVKDGKLVLHLDNGKTKTFDDEGDGNNDGYQLVDFQPATHIFVVADVLIDDTIWTVVEGRSGRVITFKTDVRPFVSPDGKWIAAIRVEDHDNEGMSILDNTGPSLKKVWRSAAENRRLPAEAAFMVWIDNDHIVFPDVPGMTLARTEGVWRLHEPEHPIGDSRKP